MYAILVLRRDGHTGLLCDGHVLDQLVEADSPEVAVKSVPQVLHCETNERLSDGQLLWTIEISAHTPLYGQSTQSDKIVFKRVRRLYTTSEQESEICYYHSMRRAKAKSSPQNQKQVERLSSYIGNCQENLAASLGRLDPRGVVPETIGKHLDELAVRVIDPLLAAPHNHGIRSKQHRLLTAARRVAEEYPSWRAVVSLSDTRDEGTVYYYDPSSPLTAKDGKELPLAWLSGPNDEGRFGVLAPGELQRRLLEIANK